LIFAPTRTWSRITLGSPIATLYVKFIGSRGLSRHDPWTVKIRTVKIGIVAETELKQLW
jgi:hypothetical protein